MLSILVVSKTLPYSSLYRETRRVKIAVAAIKITCTTVIEELCKSNLETQNSTLIVSVFFLPLQISKNINDGLQKKQKKE